MHACHKVTKKRPGMSQAAEANISVLIKFLCKRTSEVLSSRLISHNVELHWTQLTPHNMKPHNLIKIFHTYI